MIIGLTGKNGSGKGEVAKYLQERGFHYHSLSDVLREEAAKEGVAVTRDHLVQIGNRLRDQGGPGVLAEKIVAKLDPEKYYVIDSIRHPSEVQALKRRKDFYLLEVYAPQKLRFERIKQRNREKDPKTFEEFQALETREGSSEKATDQQLDATLSLADRKIKNNGPLKELQDEIKTVLLEVRQGIKRPDWDHYFMNIAKVVALRSNCLKRRVAAVIVKDKRIIATGYNGTPRGVTNCDEGGCPRCASIDASGKGLSECLCSHAEENAIVQSAYHGVSVKGAVIYTTFSPCLMCTKMIINAGITEVVYHADYSIQETPLRLLKEAGISARKIECAD